jgi:uncharacterized RDD family membrane protein YckC
MENKKLTIKLRLASMLLDHAIMCLVIVPPLIILTAIWRFDSPFERHLIENIAFFLMVFVYLNKDFLKGRSLAKRILGLAVKDIRTGEPANEFQCFLRNITIPVCWPLEVLISLFPGRRKLGDFIARTKVDFIEQEIEKSFLEDLKTFRPRTTTLIAVLFGLIYVGVLWYFMDNLLELFW